MVVITTVQHKVSVIVPTCDRPALLRQALASIRALEGPDLTFEILVGDNGSTPETPAVAEEFGAIYLKAVTRGPSAARNVGLRAATGEYIAFLDDDDVWLPENVRPHIAHLEQNPALDAVIGQAVYADANLVPIGSPWPKEAPRGKDQLLKKMLSDFFPQIGTCIARIRVRKSVGEFDETLIAGEDRDWLLWVARRRGLGFVAKPCILFRERAAGISDSQQQERAKYARRVFFRHALPEWRLWRSPLDFSKAYAGTLMHLYFHFVDAAVKRAMRGERKDALRAIAATLGIFPIRAAYHLVAPRPLRKAFWASIAPRHSPSKHPRP